MKIPASLAGCYTAALPFFQNTLAGDLVFKREYHVRRGYCCGNHCRHCPYGDEETSTRTGALGT